MISLITYSSREPFHRNGKQLIKQASLQFDAVYHYKPSDIQDFINQYPNLFRYKKGGGLWCWKPYILQTYLLKSFNTDKVFLDKTHNNDIVLYCDTDIILTGNLAKLIQDYFDHHDIDVAVVKNHHLSNHWKDTHLEVKWSKGDAFDRIGVDMFNMYEELQVWSGFIALRNNNKTRQIIDDWLKFTTDEQIISDKPSIYPNHPSFKENRSDQTTLSLVLKKHKIDLSDNELSQALISGKYIQYMK